MGAITAKWLEPHLRSIGYGADLLVSAFPVPGSARRALVAFARRPTDARSACIAVVEAAESAEAAADCRLIGSPVVFVCLSHGLHVWRQNVSEPVLIADVSEADVPIWLERNSGQLSPDAIYRAKTLGRFEVQHTLPFVDVGWLPFVEGRIGQELGSLVERCVKIAMSPRDLADENAFQVRATFQQVFWLIAAKLLRDKGVESFVDLDPMDVDGAFRRVGRHYGTRSHVLETRRSPRALAKVASEIERAGDFRHITTESLAYVYENTLVDRNVRRLLGIHSTPAYLVEYMLARLRPYIEAMPEHRRFVLEPACGHAAFLTSIVRLLRDLRPEGSNEDRHTYLQRRLRGVEVDQFAVEIARLSLTLADIPNPDGWLLTNKNMFVGKLVESLSSEADILLSNPPFEDFAAEERSSVAATGSSEPLPNKAGELLRRAMPHLPEGALVGLILPRTLLHNQSYVELRREILSRFTLIEICQLPDNVFQHSDAESAVLLAVKVAPSPTTVFRYRVVRERSVGEFRLYSKASDEWLVSQAKVLETGNAGLSLPQLEELWSFLSESVRLFDIADVGKGLEFHSAGNRPRNARTKSRERLPGAVRGYVGFTARHCRFTDEAPPEAWFNLDERVIRRPLLGTQVGFPQVLLNYSPVDRGPWRLKAIIDQSGHAVESTFLIVRPRDEAYPLEYFWALCNSPMANAYAFCFSGKRHNKAETIRRMPVPAVAPEEAEEIAESVREYFAAVHNAANLFNEPAGERATLEKLLIVDAQILRLYNLPRDLEQRLLKFFEGYERTSMRPRPTGYTGDVEAAYWRIRWSLGDRRPAFKASFAVWQEELSRLHRDPTRWLRRPNSTLGGRVPATMIGTRDESELRDVIAAVVHGVPT